MSQAPRRTGSATRQFIQEQIKDFILRERLRPGDLLPTEPALMAQLDVGRHPLREAIKGLQAIGIVEVRHGHGTYVGDASLAGLESGLAFRIAQSLADQSLESIRHLLQAREALEVGLAHDVVARVDDAQLAALTRIVEAMRVKAAADEDFADEDAEFHAALYEPLGNPLVLELVAIFWRSFNNIADTLGTEPEPTQPKLDRHVNLLTPLRARDTDAFAAAMRRHFDGVKIRLGAVEAR
ncbi:FadR/GntR family transcriptional regulator [Propionibacteriaceae bacterium Y2011]|uniref:FadR/GntR family transcriptional regulator n=1 Tax=Microlunatus sp. Y2014 TaxID=3418488 RepID=UPI003B479526